MNPFYTGRSGNQTKFGSRKPEARGFLTPDANNFKAEGQWKATVALHYLPALHPAHSSADTTVPSVLPVFNLPDSRQDLQKQHWRKGSTPATAPVSPLLQHYCMNQSA